jgi:hypothetical protein
MATGRNTLLTKQVGEYLVAAELGRRGFIATTFTGNVPHFDILAADANGRSLPIQVKAIKGGDWQFDARQFVNIALRGERQVLGAKTKAPHDGLVCVFVVVSEKYGTDRFFVFEWLDLQRIAATSYRWYIKAKGGIRSRNPGSFHLGVSPDALSEFETTTDKDAWGLIALCLKQKRAGALGLAQRSLANCPRRKGPAKRRF